MDETASGWSYANDARILTAFLGATLVFFGIDGAIVLSAPTDPEIIGLADVVLASGIFILLFGVLLFLPRMLGRGSVSYSMHVERSLEDAQALVTQAIEKSGRAARVEVAGGRSKRPPRTVRVEGEAARFVLRAAPYRERTSAGSPWTEIVQAGLRDPEDGTAKDLRDRVVAAINAPPA